MSKILLYILLVLASGQAISAERAIICARYQTQSGWSKNYKVEATILKGSELNQKTNSFDFAAFSTYVVIFWDKDQVSIIEMSYPYLTFVAMDGEDRRGVKWEVAKTTYCY